MKRKLFSLMTLLLCAVTSAWANYSSVTEGGITTLTWDFAEYTSTVSIATGETNVYHDLTFYGGGGSKKETLTTSGFLFQGRTANWSGTWGRYIVFTPASSGTLTITFSASNADRLSIVGTTLTDFKNVDVSVDDNGVVAFAGTSSSTSYDATLTAGTTYYIMAKEKLTISRIQYVYAAAAGNAPSTPTFTPDGGSVDGNTTVTIASTDASKIFYYWSDSSTPAEVGDVSYTEASGSSFDATVPNETNAAKYLHAYGWNSYNSGSTSSIYSKSFNITKIQTAAGLAYATTAVSKNIGDAAFTNALTNPNSLTVTYSITTNGTNSTINASTGEVTIGDAAGEETITASFVGNEDYAAGEATYTLTVAQAAVEVPSYTVGTYNYDEDGYEVTFKCETDGATLEYILTTENPNDGSQADYFDGTHGTIQTYTGPIYIYGQRVLIKASKAGYTTSYSAKGTRYQASAKPTGTSPEVVSWNVRGNSTGETNAAHGNRAVNLSANHFAGVQSGLGDNTFKMRVTPNSIVPIVDGVTKCMQMTVNKGYKVTKVTFNDIRVNDKASNKKSITMSKVYVDGVEVEGAFDAFELAAYDTEGSVEKEIDLTGAANGGATSSIVIAFSDPTTEGYSASTQYDAIITTTYTNTEAVSTAADRYYATHIAAADLDFTSVSSDVTAYIATGLNDARTAVIIEPVSQVPANAPILVKTATEGATVNVPLATSTPDALTTNLLVEGDGTTINTATDTDTYYYLANNLFHKATSGTLQSGKAYLKLEGVAPASAHTLTIGFDDETTGIQTVSNEVKGLFDGEFYNIAGQRVAMPQKGLYIVNGKKVLVK